MTKRNYKGISQNVITIILVVVGLIAGVVIFLINSGKDERSIKDPDSYETVTLDDGSTIAIPETFEEVEGYHTSTGISTVGCFENEKAAVAVAKQANVNKLTIDDIVINTQNATLNGEKLNVTKKGSYCYYSYKDDSGDFFETSDDSAYLIVAYYVNDAYLYVVTTACYYEDAADYEEYMFQWIESFSL